MDVLLTYLIFSVGLNLVLFLAAYVFQTDKITDLSYSFTFIAIATYPFFQSEQSLVDIILNVAVVIWGIRLGSYLLYRVSVIGHDKRFDEIRNNFLSFFVFWLIQGLTCFIVMVPIILANNSTGKGTNVIFVLASLLAVIGFIVEFVSDQQKFKFKRSHPTKFMNRGLWSHLQHPNYTGELMFWWGLFLACLPFTVWYYAIIGPIWITLIITRLSGIPILQKKWKKTYGNDPTFQQYQKRAYKLIPYVY